jgi:predicted site-specific integrase-resolvase
VVKWENILTREGVMRILRISPATYKRWLKDGFLAKIKRKVGNRFLFDKEELLKEIDKLPER